MNHEDLTKSDDVGVRWQAQMEEHLAAVRGYSREAALIGIDRDVAATRAALANANATAALTLAVSIGQDFSEISNALSAISDGITELVGYQRNRM